MLADSLNAMAAQLDERIQKILRQQSEHQAMLSSMEEGVMAVDHSGTVLSVNDPCAALGRRADKLRGRSIYEVLRKPDLLKFIENSQASAKSLDGDLRFFSPEERWLHAHGTALHDARGQKIGVLIVLHDVTRLRHLENVRRDFVANVSHELRTPITSIKGFVETLLDDGLDDRANVMRFLGIVLRQVNRLDAIINDLLLLSRIERGNEDQRIETDAEPLVQVLQVAQETCEKKAQDKSIQIDRRLPLRPRGQDQRAAAGASGHQSDRQCHQVQRRRGDGPRHRRAASSPRRDPRDRQRLRHRGQSPPPALRAVLSGRQGPQPRVGRHRPGPGHRQAHHDGPPGIGAGGERGRPRQHVHAAFAAGSFQSRRSPGRRAAGRSRRAESHLVSGDPAVALGRFNIPNRRLGRIGRPFFEDRHVDPGRPLLTPQGPEPLLLRGEGPPFPIPFNEIADPLNALDDQVNSNNQ